MRITNIKLYGFKDKKRIVNLSFPEESVSVIYGVNGSGKTSLLKVINAILIKDESTLLKENINIIEITYKENRSRKKSISIKRKNVESNYSDELGEILVSDFPNKNKEQIIQYILSNHETEDKYDWNQFDESNLGDVSSILFGVNRGISTPVNIPIDQIEDFIKSRGIKYGLSRNAGISLAEDLTDYLNRYRIKRNRNIQRRKTYNLDTKNCILDKIDMETVEELIFNRFKLANLKKTERVNNALFETLSDAIYSDELDNGKKIHQIPEGFETTLIENRDKLLEALRNSPDNTLQKNIIKIMEKKNIKKILGECKKNDLLLNLLVKMIEELKEEESILESINLLEMIFNRQISSNKKLVVDKDGVYIKFKDEENNHGLSGLSSGERHLLSFLTIFLIDANQRDLIMIDEPELSLNLKWQREILEILQIVAPASQIIVASHSPAISRRNTNYLVKLS
ncbi:AAA family ATPase [Abyssisolibacter fermentans]|uniref:AAA family ATPase n=1 Tax=Abyssisolibacter fermentans TaxID=1766203 RepID=UPI0008341713|nr:AAA family ATPase [Abyssisolibacter fermentans]